jgi:PAS domain S-box-containing protein
MAEDIECADGKLDASERLYRAIVDNAHEGICAIDADGRILYANPRAAEMLGYTADEIRGRPTTDFVFEEDHAEALALRERTNAGQRLKFDFRLRHRTGSIVWVAVAAARVQDDDGQAVARVIMISDVTARREAEQAQRDSERRLRILLDSHPDSIMRLTREGVYLDAHIMERERHKVPFEATELIGKTPADFFEPGFASRHVQLGQRALDTGAIHLWDFDRPVDGSTAHYEARFVPSADDEVIVTVRNVTQRKRVENEVSALAAGLEA